MKKIFVPGLIAGVLMLIVGMAFNQAINWIFPSIGEEYQNVQIFRPWSDPLMQLYFLYPFVLGVVLSYAWHRLHSVFPGKGNKKVQNFAIFYWIVAAVPGMFITLSSFQVSFMMILSWSLVGLLQAFTGVWIINKRQA